MAGFSVNHQLVSLDIDFKKHAVKGLTELSIEPKEQDLSVIYLNCERPVVVCANINSINCEFRRIAPSTRQNQLRKYRHLQGDDKGELEIIIPSSVKIERSEDISAENEEEVLFKTLKLRIEFYIIKPSSGLVFGTSDIDERLFSVHTESQMYPSSTRAWLPCLDDVHERSTWDLFYSVPACIGSLEFPKSLLPITVISTGELSSLVVHPRDPTKRIYRYIMSTTSPACSLGFAIGPFASACTLDASLLVNSTDLHIDGGSRNGRGEQSDTAIGEKTTGNGAQREEHDSKDLSNESSTNTNPEGITDKNSRDKNASLVDTTENQTARTNHNSKLKKSTVDAIGGVYAFTYPGMQAELETTCGFIPEALAFYSQEFGSYPYTTYKVVFMDGLSEPIITCASLTILSTDFLHPSNIIEQVYETRRCLGLAIAQQWFGTYITPETWGDNWLVVGLAGFAAGLFVKHNLGNNEYRYRLKKDMTRLCHADVNQRPISYPGQPLITNPSEIRFIQLKAPIVLYMLDKRMMKGGLSLGLHRIVPKILVAAMSGDLGASNAVGTGWFLKMCRKVSGVDLKVFSDQWILGTGCPVFHFSYAFNRKKLVVEITMHQESTNSKATSPWAKPQLFHGQMTARIREADGTPYEHVLDIHDSCKKFEVQFNTKYKRIRRSTKRFHMRQMAAAAEELSVNTDVLGIEEDDETYSNIALFGAENEQEKSNWRVVEWGEDDEESLASATFEWIRMDSDLEWACIIHFEQPDFMWAAQLQKDRDVAAQLEAVDALQYLPSSAASTTLMRTVMDGRVFYRVRVDAAMALEKFAKDSLDWIGLHHLIKIYKHRFCLPPASDSASDQGDSEDISVARLPKPNNFTNIGEYFTQKAILAALSNVRDTNNEAPLAARRLMMSALKYNDNSENVYSDCYYLSSLIESLANSVIQSDRFTSRYSVAAEPKDDDSVLSEIERLRKVDMLVPSYHNVVTETTLVVLLKLSLVQPQEHIFNTALFFSMASPKSYSLVREVAIGGLLLHWGVTERVFNRFFLALATDFECSVVANTVSHYIMEMMMIRAMLFGQQHNSLMFIEEEGSSATEHIDTDARLVGGLESFIETIEDTAEARLIVSSAMYDSAPSTAARTLLEFFHMLVYQTTDSSLPQPATTHKKLKIKLGSKLKPSSTSAASSDSEDVPLMARRYPQVQDPYSTEHIPGESQISQPPPSSADRVKRRRSKHLRNETIVENSSRVSSPSYTLPAIAGTRPPPIEGYGANEIKSLESEKKPLESEIKPPESERKPSITSSSTKLKLKLKLVKTPNTPGDAPTPVATSHSTQHSRQHSRQQSTSFSPSMSPPYYHTTAPRVSSPLASHAMSPKRATPVELSPAYTPQVDTIIQHRPESRPSSRPMTPYNEAPPKSRGHSRPTTPAIHELLSRLPANDKKQLARILRKVSRDPSAFPFLRPVDVVLDCCPTYYEIIKRPMDLGTMKTKLETGKYASAAQFESDIRLMLANCFEFNPPGTPVYNLGQDVESAFEREWKAAGFAAPIEHGITISADTPKTNRRKLDEDTISVKKIKIPKIENRKPIKLKISKAATPKSTEAESSGGTSLRNGSASSSRSAKDNLEALDDPDAILAYLDTNGATRSLPKIPKQSTPKTKASGNTNDQTPSIPSSTWLVNFKRILLRVQAQPASLEFMAPVDPIKQNVPTYFDIIKHPMDLGTVHRKFTNGEYKTPAQAYSDVKLIFDNCARFNTHGTYVYTQGETLREVFNRAWSQHMGTDSPNPSVETLPHEIVIDDKMRSSVRAVLGKIKRNSSAWPFLKPVDPIALGVPTYLDIVKNPMDLDTIQKKISRREYETVGDFVCDVRLMIDDCYLFNLKDTPVHECGNVIENLARNLFKKEGWLTWF